MIIVLVVHSWSQKEELCQKIVVWHCNRSHGQHKWWCTFASAGQEGAQQSQFFHHLVCSEQLWMTRLLGGNACVKTTKGNSVKSLCTTQRQTQWVEVISAKKSSLLSPAKQWVSGYLDCPNHVTAYPISVCPTSFSSPDQNSCGESIAKDWTHDSGIESHPPDWIVADLKSLLLAAMYDVLYGTVRRNTAQTVLVVRRLIALALLRRTTYY